MTFKKENYPANWKAIRLSILARAGGCCEGTERFPDCRAANYQPHPVTGSKVVLTIAHLDHNTRNNDHGNLRALCQRCHLDWDNHLNPGFFAQYRRSKALKCRH